MKYNFTVTEGGTLSNAVKSNVPLLKKGREKSLISSREIKVNGVRVNADIRLKRGDEVDIFVPDAYLDNINIITVFEDENILIVDKPARIESVRELPALLSNGSWLKPAHRLDTNTTGLIILAKNDAAYNSLVVAFRERTIEKTYIATVLGNLSGSGELTGYLTKDEKNGKVTVADEPSANASEAITHYEVLSRDGELAAVKLQPLTGRTHQLRAQLAHAHSPILGDGKYGDFAANKRFNAKCQHLRSVQITFNEMNSPLRYLKGKSFKVD